MLGEAENDARLWRVGRRVCAGPATIESQWESEFQADRHCEAHHCLTLLTPIDVLTPRNYGARPSRSSVTFGGKRL